MDSQTLITPETHKERRYCMICGVNHECVKFNDSWFIVCPRVAKNSGIDKGSCTLEVLLDGRWRAVNVRDRG